MQFLRPGHRLQNLAARIVEKKLNSVAVGLGILAVGASAVDAHFYHGLARTAWEINAGVNLAFVSLNAPIVASPRFEAALEQLGPRLQSKLASYLGVS